MHGRLVVPDDHIAGAPFVPQGIFRPRRPLQQIVQQRSRLFFRPADDATGVCADQNGFSSVARIRPHQLVPNRRKMRALFRREFEPHQRTPMHEIVLYIERIQFRFPLVGQAVIGRTGRGKFRRPAFRRHLARGQDRAQRGDRFEATVGMPQIVGLLVGHAAVIHRDRLTGLDVEVGLPREDGTGRRVCGLGPFTRAETFAERDLALVVERLIGKDQHRVPIKRVANLP